MNADLLIWLADTGSWAWHTALSLLLVLNFTAVTVVLVTRSRTLVDRWTTRWLVANVALLGFGAGTPLLTGAARLVVSALPDLGRAAATIPK